ncbi:AraC family transcriptional regulator [Aureivirga marina]|uniref:AraC family transcriptional regulator n=1 Tax=Aureivirga marina TaxID=1182451 RepID=UPI0018CAB7B4|nr:AraC family transcriptional regulator [Aureivirga marina]
MNKNFVYIANKSIYKGERNLYKRTLFGCFLLLYIIGYGQKIDEKILVNQSFQSIQKYIDAQQIYQDGIPVERNDSLYNYYLNVYLKKAKITQNYEEMILTYLKLSTISKNDSILNKYSDSIQTIYEKVRPSFRIMHAYSFRAQDLYSRNRYKLAIKDYDKTVEIAQKLKDEDQIYLTKMFIANLHGEIGEYGKELDIIEEVLKAHQRKKFSWMEIYYQDIAASYIHNNRLDSAKVYIEKGIKEGGTQKIQYFNLVMYAGMYHYMNKDYQKSIDSLQKVKTNYSDKIYHEREKLLAVDLYPDYYLGKAIFEQSGKKEDALPYFLKVDSVMQKYNDADYNVMDTYDFLVDFYKEKGDAKNQLKYLENQIRLDNYLDDKYRTVVNNINKTYRIDDVKKAKDELITELQADNSNFMNWIIGLVLLAFSLGIMIFFQRKRNRDRLELLKTRNKKLKEYKDISEIQKAAQKEEKIEEDVPKVEEKKEEKKDFEISEKLVEEILEKLEKFEKSTKFTNKKYTLSSLAKELNTNSSYLSKIINAEKKLNFSTYLNTLRIEFAIQKLKEDKKFRSFTVKAIAEEVGFKTAQSFSATFFKYKGLYPSAFIKQLQEDIKEEKSIS